MALPIVFYSLYSNLYGVANGTHKTAGEISND